MERLGAGAVFAGRYRIERLVREEIGGAIYAAVDAGRTRGLRIYEVDPSEWVEAQQELPKLKPYFALLSRHVAEPFDIATDEATRTFYVVTDAARESFEARLARAALSPSEAGAFVVQLGEALGKVHAAGLVHGELAPESIELAPEGPGAPPFHLYVVDLGWRRVVGRLRLRERVVRPTYFAPELAMPNGKPDARADVWSMGLLAFRALTGKHYWRAANEAAMDYPAVLRDIVGGAIVPASERARELGVDVPISLSFDVWFGRMVARDPAARFADANEAARAFGGVSTTSVPSVPAAAPATVVAVPNVGSTVVGDIEIYLPKEAKRFERADATAPMLPDKEVVLAGASAPIVAGTTARMAENQAGATRAATTTPAMTERASAPKASVAAIPIAPAAREAEGGSRTILLASLAVLLVGCIGLVVWQLVDHRAPAPPPTSGLDDDSPSVTTDPGGPKDTSARNKWIRVETPPTPWSLGLDRDDVPPWVTGYRPSRARTTPSEPFEMQQHEVTWGEIDSYLARTNAKVSPPSYVPYGEAGESFPATGVSWATANAYCHEIGAGLPHEDQWELAARGVDRKRFPWGDGRIDVANTHAFVGANAKLVAVMNEAQDHTPSQLFDLMGNAQEWTADAYDDDFDPADEAWMEPDLSYRVVRGLPLAEEPFELALANAGAWTREAVCAAGHCADPNDVTLGEPALDVRLAFVSALDGATGAARSSFQATVRSPDVRTAILGCFAAAPQNDVATMRAMVNVTFARGMGAAIACVDDDGVPTSADCCANGDDGCHYAPSSNAVVSFEKEESPVAPVSEEATTCAIEVLRKALGAPDGKWPEGKDAFTASILYLRIRATKPRDFELIGFRCARPVK